MTVLNAPTLVLNKGWEAVRVEPVRHSICKVFKGLARFVDHDDYSTYEWDDWATLFSYPLEDAVDFSCVKLTSGIKVRVPEVIVLSKFDRVPRTTVKLSRRNIFIRDGYRCQYTGKKLKSNEGTLDHVMPKSRGGRTTWENIVLCSVEANSRKGNRTPEEAGMKLVKEPKKPFWDPVFTHYVSEHPASWSKFINTDKWNENGYWDVELKP